MNFNPPYSEDSHDDVPDCKVTGIKHGGAAIIELFKKIAATSEGEALLKFQISIVVLLIASFMLFWNLGYYSLWEDEANTAMAAKSVARTGDTYAIVDGNLVAYNNGIYLNSKLRDRITPVLSVYATALSFLCFGENVRAARLPFALAGLLTVALLLRWAAKGGIRHLLLVSILMLGNASFFLFFRSCRYYGFVMFFAFLVFYLYWHWNGERKKAVFLSLALLGLMFSYYVTYVGVTAALALDYILWRRKEVSLDWRNWLVIIIPQVAGVIAACLFWNPYSTAHGNWEGNSVAGMITLFFWHIRDMNRCEFYSAFLMIIALGLGWYYKQKSIGRAMLAVVVIVAATVPLTDQIVKVTSVADVRFMPVVIALCLLVEARGISMLCGGRTLASVIVAILAAFSNFSNGGIFLPEGVRSTAYLYARELVSPPNNDPFKPTADWINKNIPTGALVYVTPNANIYPLMFLANRVFYAWQLEPDARSRDQLKDVLPVFVKGESIPDFIIAFGPRVQEVRDLVGKYCPPTVKYNELAQSEIFANAMFRPELFWRSFVSLRGYSDDYKIKIFKREGFDPAKIPYNPALRPPAKTPPAAQPPATAQPAPAK